MIAKTKFDQWFLHGCILGCLLAWAAPMVAPLEAQDHGSFSGTWAASSNAPPGIAAAPSPILGPRFVLQLDGDTLTVTRPVREQSIAAIFKLDGSRTSFRIPGRMCEGDSEFIETAAWEGSALVLTGVGRVPPGGGTPTQFSVKRTLRTQDANTLIVEGSMTQRGETRAVATVYKRSADSLPPPKADDGVQGAAATIAQVSWISGFWSGPNGNVNVEERWTPAASGAILGLGRTLRGSLMASFEFLCIAERGGTLVYTAMPDGRTTPTHFTLTSVTATSAAFENPAHDFPKLVRYTLKEDGTLETMIAGAAGQRSQTFTLKRVE